MHNPGSSGDIAVIRKEQIRRVKRTILCSRNPEARAKDNRYNNQPHVAKRRAQQRYARYWGNSEYREQLNAKGVEYFKANKERIYKRIKARKTITQDNDRAYIREWQRNKRQTDPQYKIGNRLRSRLWHAVTGGGGNKATKTMELVGCTMDELRKHIESKFQPGMNWKRFMAGQIHLDHMVPCAEFDLKDPEQQKRCFHYSNFQPLWASKNLSKSDTITACQPCLLL